MMRMTLCFAVAALAVVGASCTGKEKTCAADQTLVDGNCYSLQSDSQNCGTVGDACGAAQGCLNGTCVDCATSNGACTPAVVAACANLNQVRLLRADLSLANAPLATDQLPIGFASNGGKLFVANSRSSTISTVTLSPPAATSGSSAIVVSSAGAGFGDLEYLASYGAYLVASNDATNTLAVVNPTAGKVVAEVALSGVSPGAFPLGIAFVGTKGYVALNGIDSIGVLDASAMPNLALRPATIDLRTLQVGTTHPMPSRLAVVGTRLYVTLGDLDPTTFTPAPNGHGRVAIVDTTTDALVGFPLDLGAACVNPSGMAVSGTTLWVACGFNAYNSSQVTGGALVPIDLSAATPVVGPPITLTDHAVGSIAFCGGRGYAGATESGNVIAFDPTAHAIAATALVCPPNPGKASFVPDVACAQ